MTSKLSTWQAEH